MAGGIDLLISPSDGAKERGGCAESIYLSQNLQNLLYGWLYKTHVSTHI